MRPVETPNERCTFLKFCDKIPLFASKAAQGGMTMKISKKDALMWFEFFAALPEEEELMPHQQEIALAALAQIEAAVNKRREAMASRIDGLQSLSGRTYFVGDRAKFPRGCCSCLLGTGLSAVRKTNRCNVQCKFCYNYGELDVQPPIGEGMWEIGGTKFYEDDIDLLLSIQKKPTGVAYVYLEPFMEIEKYYGIIRKFHEAGVHQHMYTNGTLATEENLRALGEAGLDELRFNLGASGCADRVIENMATAKKYIRYMGIETPITPELYETFMQKKEKILATGIDFMNCAELHLNANNIDNTGMAAAYNQTTDVLKRWQGEGTSNSMPRAVFGDPNQNTRVSDRFVENGSYLRLKNITLSYTFPKQWLQKAQIENARLSLSCENVATITGYSGFDPEVGINGIDQNRYPISRTFSLGLNFNF